MVSNTRCFHEEKTQYLSVEQMNYIILIVIVLLLIFFTWYLFLRKPKKPLTKDEVFALVLDGEYSVEVWFSGCGKVLGPERFQEVELLQQRLSIGKILIAKPINQVWIGDKLYFIEDPKVFARNKSIRFNQALQKAYIKAIKSPTTMAFQFPTYITEEEVKYMNPIQKIKYQEWVAGITSKMNDKLLKYRNNINSVVKKNYIQNTEDYLEAHGLFREQALPQAIKLFLERAKIRAEKGQIFYPRMVNKTPDPSKFSVKDNAEIEEIVDGLQEQRALTHARGNFFRKREKTQGFTADNRAGDPRIVPTAGNAENPEGFAYMGIPINGEPYLMMGDIQENNVPFPRYNHADFRNPNVFTREGGNEYGQWGHYNAYAVAAVQYQEEDPDETIAQRMERIRKRDNKKNATFSQSVHDAVFAAEVNDAVKSHLYREGAAVSQVDRLARDFSRKYPAQAEKYRNLFTEDKNKDYMVSFASLVYDQKNESVKDNLIDALGLEIGNIAPYCAEGRKNKTWALLQGIDKTGYGGNAVSRIELMDSLLNEFGKVTNTVGLSPTEMISQVEGFAKEYSTKFPQFKEEIAKKGVEAKGVIEELYEDEVNLYGSTEGLMPETYCIPAAVEGYIPVSPNTEILIEDNDQESVSQKSLTTMDNVREGFQSLWADGIGKGTATGLNFGQKPDHIIYGATIPQERTLMDPGAHRLDPGTFGLVGQAGVFGYGLGNQPIEFPQDSYTGKNSFTGDNPEGFKIFGADNNSPFGDLVDTNFGMLPTQGFTPQKVSAIVNEPIPGPGAWKMPKPILYSKQDDQYGVYPVTDTNLNLLKNFTGADKQNSGDIWELNSQYDLPTDPHAQSPDTILQELRVDARNPMDLFTVDNIKSPPKSQGFIQGFTPNGVDAIVGAKQEDQYSVYPITGTKMSLIENFQGATGVNTNWESNAQYIPPAVITPQIPNKILRELIADADNTNQGFTLDDPAGFSAIDAIVNNKLPDNSRWIVLPVRHENEKKFFSTIETFVPDSKFNIVERFTPVDNHASATTIAFGLKTKNSSENFSVDGMPNMIPPVAAMLPVDLSKIKSPAPGSVLDVYTHPGEIMSI